MEKSEYPEIDALNEIYVKHKFEFKVSPTEILSDDKDYRAVTFGLGGKTFEIFVDDVLEDLKYNYPLLNLCIVLRELEEYHDANDYLLWCQERSFDPAIEQVRAYHMHLADVYRDVEQIIGKIESKVSDWDFEMECGAAYVLRKQD